MNINKSLYGMFQYPLYWYNRLEGAFEEICFKPSPLDHYMFYGKGVIEIIYVDDVLLFVTDQYKIDEVIKELEDSSISFTVGEGAYDFL